MPFSQSNDSSTSNLFTNSGASLVGTATGNTVQKELDGIYKIVSVQDYMTDAEKASADNPFGTVDHSAAFKQAFDSGSNIIFVPPVKGRYIVGDVVIPFGVKMIGKIGRRPYNVTGDANFNNVGSVIRKKMALRICFCGIPIALQKK